MELAQQENAQAVILQQPSDQQLVIKIEQDTDLVVIGSFLITAFVVWISAKYQLRSNQKIIDAQRISTIMGLEAQRRQKINDEMQLLAARYIHLADEINLEVKVLLEFESDNNQNFRSTYQELIVKFTELKKLAYQLDGYLYRKLDKDLDIMTEKMLITGFFAEQIPFALLKLEKNQSSLSNSKITENFKAYDEKIQSLDLLIKDKINHDWSTIFIKN